MTQKKRIFYETEEVVTKVKKGYIDLNMDYFQFYSNAFHHLASVSSVCGKDFILWVMGKVNDENEFAYSRAMFEQFNDDLSKIKTPKSYQQNTLDIGIKELVDNGILIRLGRGKYKVNPLLFWSDDINKRVQAVKVLHTNEIAAPKKVTGTKLPEEQKQKPNDSNQLIDSDTTVCSGD
jgi:hypothetical protein